MFENLIHLLNSFVLCRVGPTRRSTQQKKNLSSITQTSWSLIFERRKLEASKSLFQTRISKSSYVQTVLAQLEKLDLLSRIFAQILRAVFFEGHFRYFPLWWKLSLIALCQQLSEKSSANTAIKKSTFDLTFVNHFDVETNIVVFEKDQRSDLGINIATEKCLFGT